MNFSQAKRLIPVAVPVIALAIGSFGPGKGHVRAELDTIITPAAAQTANGVPGAGVHLSTLRSLSKAAYRARLTVSSSATLPSSVDLSSNAPPVGDQGPVGSCAAWAETYGLRGYYTTMAGAYPQGGLAPMFTYS